MFRCVWGSKILFYKMIFCIIIFIYQNQMKRGLYSSIKYLEIIVKLGVKFLIQLQKNMMKKKIFIPDYKNV